MDRTTHDNEGVEEQGAPPGRAVCKVSGCGRSCFAYGYCQTHHRHITTFGEPRPIRQYRRRIPGTMTFSGLRLSVECARKIEAYAKDRDIARGAAIAEILEAWNKKQEP